MGAGAVGGGAAVGPNSTGPGAGKGTPEAARGNETS